VSNGKCLTGDPDNSYWANHIEKVLGDAQGGIALQESKVVPKKTASYNMGKKGRHSRQQY
jgi:hypothetical protein